MQIFFVSSYSEGMPTVVMEHLPVVCHVLLMQYLVVMTLLLTIRLDINVNFMM